MAMPLGQQLRYWGVAALLLLALIWMMRDMLLPFLTGAALAYFLNPLVTALAARGMPRALAVTLLMALAIGVVALAVVLVVPAVVGQIVDFSQAAPDLLRRLQEVLAARFTEVATLETALRDSLSGIGQAIRDRGASLAQGVLRSVTGLVGALVFLVITPVVAFYLMLDWPRLMANIDRLLPRQHAPLLRDLAGQIDASIAGFVRGQVTVCVILAAYYALALELLGLQFGLAIGVTSGLISFIPYIGAIVGGALAIGVGLWQFWGSALDIGLVLAIFALGQVLESNILVPRIVGHSVRLHPVWLLFAVSAFGSLMGFTGMLVAVPLAASIGVLVRFAVGQYMQSSLYRSAPPPGDGPAR